MSVQKKVISLILLVFLLYAAVDYAVQRLFILPSFAALEEEEALKNMDRVVQAIDREIQILGTKANDWGSWDDTYRFMADQNDIFRKGNLQKTSLESLKINTIFIFKTNRQPLWGLIYDLDSRKELDLPELPQQLAASILTTGSYQGGGYLITSSGPLLIASKPILTSKGGGPPRGTMIFGQFLDSAGIALQTKTHLSITDISGGKMTPEHEEIVTALRGRGLGSTTIRSKGNVDRVYRVLPDLFGKPALLLQIDVPKAISGRGKEAVQYALLSLLAVGILVLTAMVCGLRWIILNPLAQLTLHTVSISQGNDLSERIELRRQDELGKLATEFNQMVERLSEARESLAQQSYSAGIAEMASGVLHNIGNAITPLSVKLSTLKSELQQAPTAEMEMAVAELADPSVPADRRADLSQFLELAGMEVATLVKQTIGNLEQISNQVDHVQMILADQQRFSRAQRVTSSLDLSSLVAKTVNLLSEEHRKDIVVEQDGSLEKISKVQGAQIALQQVLSNLLINAAESIHGSRNKNPGRISIRGAEELVDGLPMAHLYIEDNGGGIPAEGLTKLFERGFSTKKRGSGLGLHWSANTIAALKGRIYAESEGVGRGAVFHLWLPLAQEEIKVKETVL
jgi:two-component system, NtrC family, sensor kinase